MPTPKQLEKMRAAIDGALPTSMKGAAKLGSSGYRSKVVEVVPTRIELINHLLFGIGGLPVGRVGEVYGDEGCGKTSLGFEFLHAAQAAGGVGVLIETEDALVLERAEEIFGVNLEELLLCEPDTLEQVVDSLKALLKSIPKTVGPNVIVWDSLAAAELAAQAAQKAGQSKLVGTRARIMSEAMPVLCRLAREHRAAIVILNQLRQKIGVLFGPDTTTPGGNAVKFHCSWRLELWRGAEVKQGADPIGLLTTIKAVKNKLAVPFNKSKFKLKFYEGWDNDWSMMEWGKEKKILPDKAPRSKANLEIVRTGLLAYDSRRRLGDADDDSENPFDGQ